MSDNVDVARLDGALHSIVGLGGVLFERGVGAGDDDVELFENRLFIIQSAIDEDVHFAAGQQRDAFDLVLGLAYGGDVLEKFVGGEAVGDHLAFGVIGDGEIFVAERFGGLGH